MAYLFKISHPGDGSSTTMSADTIVEALEKSIDWLGGEFTVIERITAEEHVHAYSYAWGWDVCECGDRQIYFEMGP